MLQAAQHVWAIMLELPRIAPTSVHDPKQTWFERGPAATFNFGELWKGQIQRASFSTALTYLHTGMVRGCDTRFMIERLILGKG